MPIFTIGHSTLDQADFLELIKPIDVVVDIRSHPGSKWPQFQHENLKVWLPEAGKDYRLELGLGGWRAEHLPLQQRFSEFDVDLQVYAKGKFPKQRIAGQTDEDTTTPHWFNQGLWDYQFFMTLPEFFDAARSLYREAQNKAVGIMCAEVLWWKCHRSMVCDFFAMLNVDTTHLQPKLTSHRKALGNRLERYHPFVMNEWEFKGPSVVS